MSVRADIKAIRQTLENIEDLLAELVDSKRNLMAAYAEIPEEDRAGVIAFDPRKEVEQARLRRAEREGRDRHGVRSG